MEWDWDTIKGLIGDLGDQDTLGGAVTSYALNSGAGNGGLRTGAPSVPLGGAAGDTTFSNTDPYGAAAAPSGGFGTAAMDWVQRLGRGDKDAQSQARLGLGALGLLSSLVKKDRSMTPQQLAAMTKSPYSKWTPDQQQNFNSYFYSKIPQFQYKPPQGLAVGGPVHGQGCGCQMCGGGSVQAYAHGASVVPGDAKGQADTVHAKLSSGEYVWDADVVSALGDGNNAAGAKMLDEMRARIRAHKRAAPANKIPPKAHAPEAYLRGKK